MPSFDAYTEGGRVLAALAAREGIAVSQAGSFVNDVMNDVMIAASSREAGVKLVTENVEHFTAVQCHLRGFRLVHADQALT